MKTLKDHINEAFKIGNNLSEWYSYSYQPKTYQVGNLRRDCTIVGMFKDCPIL